MFKSFVHRVLYGSPYLHDPNGGGGAGAGAGAGSGGSGTGAGVGAGAVAPIVLSGDSLVDFGDGKPVKWSEASDPEKGRYITRERFDRGVQYLQGEAAKLQEAWNKYHEGKGARPQQAEPARQEDVFEGIRDQPVIDGRTLERMYQTLQAKGLGPIAQVVAQMATRMSKLEGNVTGLGKGFGSIAERDQANDFEGMITKSYGDVGAVKGLPEGLGLDANDPYLRDVAKDLYLSHDPDSWKPGEFQKHLRARVEANIAFVRALDKKAVEKAREGKRVWLNPNKGNAQPGGKPGFKFQKGADIAKMFFGDSAPQGT